MRVLHVLASQSRSWGGPPVMVSNLTRALRAFGVESTIVTLDRRYAPNVEFTSGTKVLSGGVASVSRLAIPARPGILGILIREARTADIVHIHELWHLPQVLGAITSQITDRKYVVSPHGELPASAYGQHDLAKFLLWHLYEKEILAKAAMVHALNNREKQSLRLAGVPTPVQIIPNGVDLELVDRSLTRAGHSVPALTGVRRPYILYIGRIDPRKGIEILIRAFAILAKINPEIQLVIGGPDPYGIWRRRHSADVDRLGLNRNVKFLGIVDEKDKFPLMAEAAVFVLASQGEGQSMAALEAMACGTPVIASATSNLPELEKAGAGRVIEANPEDLAEAMLALLGNDGLRERMRSNARRLVESKFSSISMARAFSSLYREIL